MSYESEQVTEVIDEQHVHTKLGYPMNWLLMQNLGVMVRSINKDDWDMLIIVDGREGSGKSVLAQQMARFCDPTFDINRICFTPYEFMKKIRDGKKGMAIIYDESRRGLSSRGSMSSTNRELTSLLAEVRQKNMFIFVVLPSIFDLDTNVSLWRARALVHTRVELIERDHRGKVVVSARSNAGREDVEAFLDRGYFDFYGEDAIINLLQSAKKAKYRYDLSNPDFSGRFSDGYVVDDVQYRAMKREAFKQFGNKILRNAMVREALKRVYLRLYERVPAHRGLVKEYRYAFEISEPTIAAWAKEGQALVEAKKEEAERLAAREQAEIAAQVKPLLLLNSEGVDTGIDIIQDGDEIELET